MQNKLISNKFLYTAIISTIVFFILLLICLFVHNSDVIYSLFNIFKNDFGNISNIYTDTEFDSYNICILQIIATITIFIASLTLIAVQLASTSYSPQIIAILSRKEPWIWRIKLIFVITFALVLILSIFPTNLFSALFIIIIGFSSLLSLIPYSGYVMKVLTPSHIISLTIDDIDFLDEKINAASYHSKFDLLVDVILAAIRIYDVSAVRFGILGYSKKIIEYIKLENLQKLEGLDEQYLYHKLFYIKQTLTLLDASNSQKFTLATIQIIELIEEIGRTATSCKNLQASYCAILNLFIIGMNNESPNSENNYKSIECISNITLSAGKLKYEGKFSVFGVNLSDITINYISFLIEKIIKNNPDYNPTLVNYGLIISLIDCYGIYEYNMNEPYVKWLVEKIIEINNGDLNQLNITFTEIDLLWSNPKGIKQIYDYILSKSNNGSK